MFYHAPSFSMQNSRPTQVVTVAKSAIVSGYIVKSASSQTEEVEDYWTCGSDEDPCSSDSCACIIDNKKEVAQAWLDFSDENYPCKDNSVPGGIKYTEQWQPTHKTAQQQCLEVYYDPSPCVKHSVQWGRVHCTSFCNSDGGDCVPKATVVS